MPPTTPRWTPGRRSPSPCAAAMNAIKGEANDRQPAPPLGPARSTRRCSPTPSAGRRSTRCSRRSRRRSPTSAGGCGPRPRCTVTTARPAVVRTCRAAAGGAGELISWDEGVDIVRDAFAAYSPQLGGLVDRAARRAVDRRRAARRQGRRRVLHVVRRRPLARAAQLVGQRRLRPDDGPRARPRLPQHHARRAHDAAAAAADGARRDGEHLLRDARRRERARAGSTAPSASRCSTSTSPARTRSSSTSTAASCSRPRSSPAASSARSASPSSTS